MARNEAIETKNRNMKSNISFNEVDELMNKEVEKFGATNVRDRINQCSGTNISVSTQLQNALVGEDHSAVIHVENKDISSTTVTGYAITGNSNSSLVSNESTGSTCTTLFEPSRTQVNSRYHNIAVVTRSPLHPVIVPQKLAKLITQNHNAVTLFSIAKSSSGGAQTKVAESRLSSWLWGDRDYVKLPCSSKNVFFSSSDPRWDSINVQLTKVISGNDLNVLLKMPNTIGNYNNADANECDFDTLKKLCQSINLKDLPCKLAEEALKLPTLLDDSVPLLKQGENKIIFMTQRQAFCFLANAFFCTYPKYATEKNRNLSHMNFFNLFQSNPHASHGNDCKVQKLECIINYFSLALNKFELGSNGSFISFERRVVKDYELPNWKQSKNVFTQLNIRESGTIEENGRDMLQVIFSNKSVGGGILGNGAIMEKIRFSICPELIVSRLFTETLTDNEVLVVTGIQKFSHYKGYGNNFGYNGSCDDSTTLDEYGRIKTEVVAMDALKFSERDKDEQYEIHNVRRELNKCFCAFKLQKPEVKQKPIASGNWGCGSFNGDVQLKLLIQWMAASFVGRDLVLFTLGDPDLKDSYKVMQVVKARRATVGRIYNILELYSNHVKKAKEMRFNSEQKPGRASSVFEYILRSKTWDKI